MSLLYGAGELSSSPVSERAMDHVVTCLHSYSRGVEQCQLSKWIIMRNKQEKNRVPNSPANPLLTAKRNRNSAARKVGQIRLMFLIHNNFWALRGGFSGRETRFFACRQGKATAA
jgi:hypothetical protein